MSTDSVRNGRAHAWFLGDVLGHAPDDLPEDHLVAETPGILLLDRHAGTMPQNDPTVVLEHAHYNVFKGK